MRNYQTFIFSEKLDCTDIHLLKAEQHVAILLLPDVSEWQDLAASV